jgi:hypothetical protein
MRVVLTIKSLYPYCINCSSLFSLTSIPSMKQLEFFYEKKTTGNGSRRGQPRSIDAIGCLGLILMWYRTKGAVTRSLALTFG